MASINQTDPKKQKFKRKINVTSDQSEEKINSKVATKKVKKISPIFITKTRRFSHYIDPTNEKVKRITFKGKIKPNKYQELEYFNQKILKNEQLSTAPNGIYTWILSESNNIYATKIESNQEIGTLHMNLIYFIERKEPSLIVVASGEFEITTDTESGQKIIAYNFKSGYFFKKILEKLRNTYYPQTNQEIQENLSKEVSKILEDKCSECKIIPKLDEDFIEYTKFISSKNIINRYTNLYNNNINEEDNIGIEKGKTNKGDPMNVKYNYLVNLTNNTKPYSRIKLTEGGKSTYKNKRKQYYTYKKFKNRK